MLINCTYSFNDHFISNTVGICLSPCVAMHVRLQDGKNTVKSQPQNYACTKFVVVVETRKIVLALSLKRIFKVTCL